MCVRLRLNCPFAKGHTHPITCFNSMCCRESAKAPTGESPLPTFRPVKAFSCLPEFVPASALPRVTLISVSIPCPKSMRLSRATHSEFGKPLLLRLLVSRHSKEMPCAVAIYCVCNDVSDMRSCFILLISDHHRAPHRGSLLINRRGGYNL